MAKLQVFDPAMCCSSGVCGPGVDPVLPRFAADLEWLRNKGVEVERYNLSQQTGAFTSNSLVKGILNAHGTRSLPLLLLDGKVVSSGAYPTRQDLARFLDFQYEPPREHPDSQQLVNIAAAPEQSR